MNLLIFYKNTFFAEYNIQKTRIYFKWVALVGDPPFWLAARGPGSLTLPSPGSGPGLSLR